MIISGLDFDYLWIFSINGLMCVLAAVTVARNPKTVYIVKIGSSSGEKNVLESYDREYIKRIVDAMNEAIVRRGKYYKPINYSKTTPLTTGSLCPSKGNGIYLVMRARA